MPNGCGFKFSVGVDGDVSLCSNENVSVEAVGPVTLSSQSLVGLSAPELTVGTDGGTSVDLSAGEPLTISAPNGIRIETPFIQIVREADSLVHADTSDDSKELITVDLLQWLFSHVHGVPPVANPLASTSTTLPLNCPVSDSVSVPNENLKGIYDAGLIVGENAGEPASVSSRVLVTAIAEYAINNTEEVLTKETKVR